MGISIEKRNMIEKKAFNMRKHIINTCINYGDGHAGPSLSCTDILATLYMDIMKVDPKNDKAPERDYFILSAGHKSLALYGALVERGFEEKNVLDTYNQLYTVTPGHPYKTKLKGIDFSTGSLGHGLPLACGVAKGLKAKRMDNKVYVVMGDGEQGEGTVWEAASVAAHHNLDNIVAVIDKNTLQINGRTSEIQKTDSLEARYLAFGWSVRVVDGHDIEELHEAFSSVPFEEGKPSIIIANTTKGKGLSFAEDNIEYHHWNPSKEEASIALDEMANNERRWENVRERS